MAERNRPHACLDEDCLSDSDHACCGGPSCDVCHPRLTQAQPESAPLAHENAALIEKAFGAGWTAALSGRSYQLALDACLAALSAAPPAQPQTSQVWRCFYCDEVFTDEAEARLHFGVDAGEFGDYPIAACKLTPEEVREIRELEAANVELRRDNERLEHYESMYLDDRAARQRLIEGREWHQELDFREGEKLVLEEKVAKLEAQKAAQPQPETPQGDGLNPVRVALLLARETLATYRHYAVADGGMPATVDALAPVIAKVDAALTITAKRASQPPPEALRAQVAAVIKANTFLQAKIERVCAENLQQAEALRALSQRYREREQTFARAIEHAKKLPRTPEVEVDINISAASANVCKWVADELDALSSSPAQHAELER